MSAPLRIITVVVTAALALSPATALAQNGAGDEQYSDPFSGQPAQSTPKAQSSPAQAQPAPRQQVQSTPQAATPAAPPSAPGAAAPAAASGAQLPRTGADVLPLALLGVVLLGAGIALLRRRGADAGR